MTAFVTSDDGTSIAYERQGSGPAVVLVGGALDDGAENAPLALGLARHFTVYNYARRGRGASGDTAPYAVEREIEDLAALVAEAGGSACLYGVSSGGALVLEAAAADVPASRLAVYEVPYPLADGPQWHRCGAKITELVAAGRRDEALELFMGSIGAPDEDIQGAKDSPYWAGLAAIAHTTAYDAACVRDGTPSRERFARITQPLLVVTGGPPADLMDRAAEAILACVPHGERQTLQGQGHVADPKVVVPMLERFFLQ
jgi:pimeloyl-ACP methyl ester carboxylesterase